MKIWAQTFLTWSLPGPKFFILSLPEAYASSADQSFCELPMFVCLVSFSMWLLFCLFNWNIFSWSTVSSSSQWSIRGGKYPCANCCWWHCVIILFQAPPAHPHIAICQLPLYQPTISTCKQVHIFLWKEIYSYPLLNMNPLYQLARKYISL